MNKKYEKGFQKVVGGSTFTLQEMLKNRTWVVTCSLCSLDDEVFPYGSIKANPSELFRGFIMPCGCSKSPKLSESQNKILVERECVKRDYVYLGWVGNYRGVNKTQIKLFDNRQNIECTVGSISSFLSGGDSVLRTYKIREAKLKDTEFYISKFMNTGAYVEGTRFHRVDRVSARGRYVYWRRFCPNCAEDEYAQHGLCDGYFEGTYDSLKKGILNCRCNPTKYSLSDDQNKFKLTKLSEKEGIKFLNWCDETLNSSANYKKFLWECKYGHRNTTSVSNFIKGRRCSDPVCRYRNFSGTNRFGFYENRESDIDFLYIIKLLNNSEEFVKIGRSFNLKERIAEIGRKYDVSIIAIHQNTHDKVFKLEQQLHILLKEYHYVPNISFKGGINECFSIGCLDDEVLSEYVNIEDC